MHSYVKAQPFQPTLALTVRQAIAIKCDQRFQVKFVQGSPGELEHLGYSHICAFLVASTRLSSSETLKKQVMFESIKFKIPADGRGRWRE